MKASHNEMKDKLKFLLDNKFPDLSGSTEFFTFGVSYRVLVPSNIFLRLRSFSGVKVQLGYLK